MDQKKCGRCEETKPVSEFHRRARSVDGLQTFCKDCHNETRRQRRAADPEKAREEHRAWRDANRDKLNEQKRQRREQDREKVLQEERAWRAANRDKTYFYSIKYRFGLTEEAYRAILDSQDGVCAICKRPCPRHSRLAVDHCHTTGMIRGLLCQPCNTAIGLLDEDADRMLAAAQYVTDKSASSHVGDEVV